MVGRSMFVRLWTHTTNHQPACHPSPAMPCSMPCPSPACVQAPYFEYVRLSAMPTAMPCPKYLSARRGVADPSTLPCINPSIYPSISQPRLSAQPPHQHVKMAVISVCPPHHPSAITRHLSQTFLLSNRSHSTPAHTPSQAARLRD